MASAIGPGDWVRYVRRMPGSGPYAQTVKPLDLGEVYQVHDVLPPELFAQRDSAGAFELEGFEGAYPDGYRWCWDVRCFDPVEPPHLSVIQALKQPLPDLVDA